jgi:REP element-mobilizing transposase RayT
LFRLDDLENQLYGIACKHSRGTPEERMSLIRLEGLTKLFGSEPRQSVMALIEQDLGRELGSDLVIRYRWCMLRGMARPLRIELAAGLYHVTSRGDRREAIFRDDQDREEWLTVLGEVCSRYNWRCHAYCEMTNHYHVVVETPDANLSRGMRQLNGVYTQKLNRRHGLVGVVCRDERKGIARAAKTVHTRRIFSSRE